MTGERSENMHDLIERRLTIRCVMTAVALVALNLAAAIATAKSFPGQNRLPREQSGPVCASYTDDGDGNFCLNLSALETGARLVRIVMGPARPRLLEIWSPVIVSVSITFLVMLVPLGRSSTLPRRARADDEGDISAGFCPGRPAARWVMIASSLVGLNLASVAYRPRLQPSEQKPPPHHFLFYTTAFLELSGGSFAQLESPVNSKRSSLFPRRADGQTRVLDTIVYRSDGSIVAYKGSPGLVGRMLSWPSVIQSPTRSLAEMWWPVVASISITLLFLGRLRSQARAHWIEPVGKMG
jgi:hypothetical protein